MYDVAQVCTKLHHRLQLSTARPPAEACSCRRIKHQLGSALQVGEVGELAELFQWRPDSDCRVGLPGFSEAERQSVGEEMSDVCVCVCVCVYWSPLFKVQWAQHFLSIFICQSHTGQLHWFRQP